MALEIAVERRFFRSGTIEMFKFLQTRHVTEFADSISIDLQKVVPPAKSHGLPISSGKQQLKLEKLIQRIVIFSAANRLNLYQRAKFANSLKWSMKESGYDHNFIDSILRILLPKM